MNYPNPCDSCEKNFCTGNRCEKWKTRYLYRQKQINGYAKKYFSDYKPEKMTESPCNRCSINEQCDNPCPARLKWWDESMERLRGK